MERLLSALGLVAILAGAWAFSADRRAVRPRTVAWGLGLQLALALFVLKVPLGQRIFAWLGEKISALLALAFKGSEFVFGPLGKAGGGSIGFIFGFQVAPSILFVGGVVGILDPLGIKEVIVTLFARVMARVVGASGAESLNAAAGVFMGQTEAPLTIRPYLNAMTDSELLCVMTSGMAHISAGIMGAYIFVAHVEARYLLASVLMPAP